MSDRADDENSSLDTLLGKYGSSKASIQLAQHGESSTDDYEEQGKREEYTSQFLREIKERAQILSRNAAKTRKAALQHVVSEDSHKTKAAAGATSLDLFMDVIRRADISDESQTEAPIPPTSDESLTVYSNDDLLPPVIPLDSAPWTREEEDTLNISHDYYQGLQTAPWGTSMTESYDEDNDSDDSDSTSEELIDSDGDDGIDGKDIDGGCEDRRSSAQDSKHSKPDADISSDFDLASYASGFTKVDGGNEEDESIDQDSQYWPQSQASGLEDSGVMSYQGKAADEESDIDEESREDKDDEVLEEEERFNEDGFVVTSEDESLPLDQNSSNFHTNSTGRLEDSEMVTETDDEAVPGALRGIPTEDDLVDGDRLVMRQDTEDNTEQIKDDGVADAADFNFEMEACPTGVQEPDIDGASSFQGIRSASPVADIPFTSPLEDVDVEMSGRKHVEEMEGESKSDDATHDLAEDPKAHTLASVKKPDDSTSDNVELQGYTWNRGENDNAAENASFVLSEVSSETDFDADVQERVSSFLDEMLGGEVPEERRSEDNREDNDDDSMLRANQEFSPRIQKPLLDSARETISSEQVARNEEDSERNEVAERWSVTRQEKSVTSVDYFSSLLIQDDEGTTDETTPGEGTGNGTGEEKMMQENLDNSTQIKCTNTNDEEVQHGENDDNALHQPDVDVGQSSIFKKSEEATQSPRLTEAPHPPTANQTSSTTKETKSQTDVQDQSKETLHTSEKQPASSKPSHADVKPQNLTADLSGEQHHTTGNSVKSKKYLEQTRTNTGQGRNWNLKGTSGHKNITHQAEHRKDKVNAAPYSTRLGQWPERMTEVQVQLPLNQDKLNDESECPKAPGNVRSLIARFSSGSASPSPAESPRSDRSFDWNVSFTDGKQKSRERLSSTGSSSSNPGKKTKSPQLPFEKSSGESSSNVQDIPWMQEVRERRRRREQGTVWGKLPR